MRFKLASAAHRHSVGAEADVPKMRAGAVRRVCGYLPKTVNDVVEPLRRTNASASAFQWR